MRDPPLEDREQHVPPEQFTWRRDPERIDIDHREVRAFPHRDRPGVRLIELSTALCPGRPCSRMIGNRPMFSDSNHLSREAVVTIVAPALQQAGLLDDRHPAQRLP